MRLLRQVHEACVTKHYSPRTEEAYTRWIDRFLRFHRGKAGKWIHPQDMTADHVESFLTYLAVRRRVAASTQNQALNALVFLFRDVVKKEIGEFNAIRAKRPIRLPTVLSQDEVRRVLAAMEPGSMHGLMAHLLYGSGLRLMECIRLRVQDLDFERNLIYVRGAKGNKDRTTLFPKSIQPDMRHQLEKVKRLHDEDLAQGYGGVYLPEALARKYPQAAQEFRWQYVFPAKRSSVDPRTRIERRHHVL